MLLAIPHVVICTVKLVKYGWEVAAGIVVTWPWHEPWHSVRFPELINCALSTCLASTITMGSASSSQIVVFITGKLALSLLTLVEYNAGEPLLTLRSGANQGVGFECARNLLLSSPDYHVIIGSRSDKKGREALSILERQRYLKGTVEYVQIDVTSDDSVARAATRIKKSLGRVDVLVNNAGIGENPDDPPHVRLRAVLATNTVGPVLVTETFLPLLRKSPKPRIVFVSSSGGSLSGAADPQSPFYGSKTGLQFSRYRASKAALNMLLIEYDKGLRDEGFTVIGADPGLVATNFLDAAKVRSLGAPEPAVGGATVAEVIKGERDADLGRVVGRYGVSPW